MIGEDLFNVQFDFGVLGLKEFDHALTPLNVTLEQLRKLATSTENIGKTTTPLPEGVVLSSQLGLRLAQIASTGVAFKKPGQCNPQHIGCQDSEVKLHDAINEQTNGIPPIVVTKESIPIAIIKTGDLMAYGIDDVPEIGIFEGVFSSVQRAIKLHRKKADGQKNSPHCIDASFFLSFSPVRIALSEFDGSILNVARGNTPSSYGTFTYNPATIRGKVVKMSMHAINMTNGEAEEYYQPTGLHWPKHAA